MSFAPAQMPLPNPTEFNYQFKFLKLMPGKSLILNSTKFQSVFESFTVNAFANGIDPKANVLQNNSIDVNF